MSMFRQFSTSLVAPKRIADFVHVKKRNALAYLSFLLLICMIPSMIFAGVVFNNTINTVQGYLQGDEIPDFTLKNGVLTSNLKDTKIIANESSKIIIDTVNKYDQKQLEAEQSVLFLSSDRLIIKDNERIQTIKFENFKDFNVTKAQVVSFVDGVASLKWLIVFAILFFWFTFRYIGALFVILFIACVGMGINTSLQTRIKFGRILVLSTFAITLPTAINEMIGISGITIPFSFLIYFTACCVILFLGMREVSYRPKVDLSNDSSGVM